MNNAATAAADDDDDDDTWPAFDLIFLLAKDDNLYWRSCDLSENHYVSPLMVE